MQTTSSAKNTWTAAVDGRASPRTTAAGTCRSMMLVLVVAAFTVPAQGELIMVEHEHHSQQTGWFCGTAAMHMLLDTPAVRNNNPIVAAMLTNPPPANPPICLNVIPFPNPTQEQWVQYQLYCASRPRNAAFFGPGTSPEGVSLTMNAYDGPPNGPDLPYGVPQGGGNHTYAWWGFPPTVLGGDRACKTMAAALSVLNRQES